MIVRNIYDYFFGSRESAPVLSKEGQEKWDKIEKAAWGLEDDSIERLRHSLIKDDSKLEHLAGLVQSAEEYRKNKDHESLEKLQRTNTLFHDLIKGSDEKELLGQVADRMTLAPIREFITKAFIEAGESDESGELESDKITVHVVKPAREEEGGDEFVMLLNLPMEQKVFRFHLPWGDALPPEWKEKTPEDVCKMIGMVMGGTVDKSESNFFLNKVSDIIDQGVKRLLEEEAEDDDAITLIEIDYAKEMENVKEEVNQKINKFFANWETEKKTGLKELEVLQDVFEFFDDEIIDLFNQYLDELMAVSFHIIEEENRGGVNFIKLPELSKKANEIQQNLVERLMAKGYKIDKEPVKTIAMKLHEQLILSRFPKDIFVILMGHDVSDDVLIACQDEVVQFKDELNGIMQEVKRLEWRIEDMKYTQEVLNLDMYRYDLEKMKEDLITLPVSEKFKELVRSLDVPEIDLSHLKEASFPKKSTLQALLDLGFNPKVLEATDDESEELLIGLEKVFGEARKQLDKVKREYEERFKAMGPLTGENLSTDFFDIYGEFQGKVDNILLPFSDLLKSYGTGPSEIVDEAYLQYGKLLIEAFDFSSVINTRELLDEGGVAKIDRDIARLGSNLDEVPIEGFEGKFIPKGVCTDFHRVSYVVMSKNEKGLVVVDKIGHNLEEKAGQLSRFINFFEENGIEYEKYRPLLNYAFQVSLADVTTLSAPYFSVLLAHSYGVTQSGTEFNFKIIDGEIKYFAKEAKLFALGNRYRIGYEVSSEFNFEGGSIRHKFKPFIREVRESPDTRTPLEGPSL